MPDDTQDFDIGMLRSKVHAIGAGLSAGLGKVARRFVEDMLFGMLASGSVRLTEIARALGESIPMHATHKRLSRNLGNVRVGNVVASNLLAEGARVVRDDALLVIDLFEIVKPYAEKMEYLNSPSSRVGEASDVGSPREDANRGYHVCEILGWDIHGRPLPQYEDLAQRMGSETDPENEISAWDNQVVTPLAQTLFSPNAPTFRIRIRRDSRSRSAGRPGLRAPVPVRHRYRRFPTTQTVAAETLAGVAGEAPWTSRDALQGNGLPVRCTRPRRLPLAARPVHDQGERPRRVLRGRPTASPSTSTRTMSILACSYTSVQCRSDCQEVRRSRFWLVAVKGMSGEANPVANDMDPFLILTTEAMPRNRKVLWDVVWSFLSYWDAIQTNQAIKGQFDFDDVRVLTYDRLRNLGILVLAASFVESQWPGIALTKSLFRAPRGRSFQFYRAETPEEETPSETD